MAGFLKCNCGDLFSAQLACQHVVSLMIVAKSEQVVFEESGEVIIPVELNY